MQKTRKITETLPNGYSSESTQRELSNEYQHDMVKMFFKDFCVFCALSECALSIVRVNTVMGMINGTVAIYGKGSWSKFVWSQAWRLEDAYWLSTLTVNNDCEYLYKTIGTAKYLT